jgi:hypothetical protein
VLGEAFLEKVLEFALAGGIAGTAMVLGWALVLADEDMLAELRH